MNKISAQNTKTNIYKKFFLAAIMLMLSIRGHGVPERFFPLQPDDTYTIGRDDVTNVKLDTEGVDDPYVRIRYDRTTGECLIKCLKEFTPPATSDLYLANEKHEMVSITEATLKHGSSFAIGMRRVSFTVLDPALLTKQRDDLKESFDSVQLELWRAQGDIKGLEQALGAEQRRRQRAEEELRVLREEGGSKRRK